MPTKEHIQNIFQALQNSICKHLEKLDGNGQFIEDSWKRPGGGGGLSRVITGGRILEKGGVNFSKVYGKTPSKILKTFNLEDSDFFATGLSIVLHPQNPMVPIIHSNIRFFEMSNGVTWFGGGIDLTPIYINKKQAQQFHRTLKTVCDKHDKNYYPTFKKQADDYFFIKHRNETRGIGGIFFDQLSQTTDKALSQHLDFVEDVGKAFMPCYGPIILENYELEYGENEKNWQNIRRGRYVEFNLVYDKGTKFGLDTNGRTESILMSLPPLAFWHYNYQVEEGTKEAETLALLKKGIDWIGIT